MKVDFSIKEKVFIILGISPLILLFFINIFISPIVGPSRECSYESEFKKLELTGVVKKKYYDLENHNLRTIEVFNKEEKLQKVLLFQKEFDEAWNQIAIDDRLSKRKNSLALTILHGTSRKSYNISFGCVKKTYWLSKFYSD